MARRAAVVLMAALIAGPALDAAAGRRQDARELDVALRPQGLARPQSGAQDDAHLRAAPGHYLHGLRSQ